MGREHKLLAKLAGIPMIVRVVDVLLESSVDSVTVVIGNRADEIQALLQGCSVEVVLNPLYEKGLSESLKCGFSSLSADTSGALVVLADMPLVDRNTIEALLAAFRVAPEQGIVVPIQDQRIGNPVIWSMHYLPEIMLLEGDRGARKLLDRFSDKVMTVNVEGDAVFFDIDTPADLEGACARFDLPENKHML